MIGSALPTDHTARLDRARLALDGLSVGDAHRGNLLPPQELERPHRGPARHGPGAVALHRIVEYIEVFYNNQRRHSSLGYVSLAEHEQSATT
jgi:hypothetical protein